MSDDVRTIEMVEGGTVRTVTYRQAVSLISRGLAVWGTTDTAAPDEDPAPPDPQSQRQDDSASASGDGSKSSKRKKSKSTVSAPAGNGQEGVEAENKPPTSG